MDTTLRRTPGRILVRTLRVLGRHLLGNAADAEDLLHEVFLALPRALERYRGSIRGQ